MYSIIINKREFINKQGNGCKDEEENIYNIRDWDERNRKFMMSIFDCVNSNKVESESIW